MVTIDPTATIEIQRPSFIGNELVRFARAARGRRLRSRVQFAQDCIVIPEGPFADEHWRPHFQPYTYHIQSPQSGNRLLAEDGLYRDGHPAAW